MSGNFRRRHFGYQRAARGVSERRRPDSAAGLAVWQTQPRGKPDSTAGPMTPRVWCHRRPDSCCYLACLQAW